MGEVRGKNNIVGKNNSDDYLKESDCLYGWEKGVGVRMGYYGRMLLMLHWKKDHLPNSCDNMYYKIASKSRILALLVMCGVERFTLSLNQSTSLTFNVSLKIEAIYVSPKATIIQYCTFRLWTVTCSENLPYISKSECRFYSEFKNDRMQMKNTS